MLLEGTFPYVTGGVSSCVYQLIKETPQINYTIIYIGAMPEFDRQYKYPIPDNVQMIKEVFLYDYKIEAIERLVDVPLDKSELLEFHQGLMKGDVASFEKIYHKYFSVHRIIEDPMQILQSKQAYEFLHEFYSSKFTPDNAVSFIDYFYTWRFSHYPIFKLIMEDIPHASLYHALCTGYAGLLGSMAKIKYNSPFVLTEHGIYINEREIEISQADWVLNVDRDLRATQKKSTFKNWWIRVFRFMSQMAYEKADRITTLYDGNVKKQLIYGADIKKIQIIPNGIKWDKYRTIVKHVYDIKAPIIGMVGRVVPIKDLKTFIKSLRVVKQSFPNFIGYIMGPTDEDMAYYEDCERLVQFYELKNNVIFTGKVQVMEYYGKIDILALSSISEGQPMVLLEAMAAGIPCMATDVGSCKELLYGRDWEDQQLGKCGEIVPFGNAQIYGDQLVAMLKDTKALAKMGDVGIIRTQKLYQERTTVNSYLNVYFDFLSSKDQLSGGDWVST